MPQDSEILKHFANDFSFRNVTVKLRHLHFLGYEIWGVSCTHIQDDHSPLPHTVQELARFLYVDQNLIWIHKICTVSRVSGDA